MVHEQDTKLRVDRIHVPKNYKLCLILCYHYCKANKFQFSSGIFKAILILNYRISRASEILVHLFIINIHPPTLKQSNVKINWYLKKKKLQFSVHDPITKHNNVALNNFLTRDNMQSSVQLFCISRTWAVSLCVLYFLCVCMSINGRKNFHISFPGSTSTFLVSMQSKKLCTINKRLRIWLIKTGKEI